MTESIKRMEWNCTGLCADWSQTDQLQVSQDEVSPQVWRELGALISEGHLISDVWPMGSRVFQATDVQGVRYLSTLSYQLEA